MVAAGAAHVGLVVVLTNDPAYWTASSRSGTSDAAFRVPEGATIGGTLAWAATAGPGTTKGREIAITLTGAYSLGWADYSDLGSAQGRFRHLVVEVLPDARPAPPPSVEQAEPARQPPASRARPPEVQERVTCREAVLAGLAALEQRTGRPDFTVAELVAEARAVGAQQSDATIRTHITSIMCVNAPAHHAVRYPDLERVAHRGPVEAAVRARVRPGTILATPAKSAPFTVADVDDRGVVLLLGGNEARTPLPWACLEGAAEFLSGAGWVPVGSVYETEGAAGTLDGYLKAWIKRATAGWVAVLLEAAGVVELDRRRPVRVRLTEGF